MRTLFSLPFLLPMLYTLQTMSLCAPGFGPPAPSVTDTFQSDLE
jgi:hypothetical protein